MPTVLRQIYFIINLININKLNVSLLVAAKKDYELFFTRNWENIFIIGKFLTLYGDFLSTPGKAGLPFNSITRPPSSAAEKCACGRATSAQAEW
jgi:hypothetical protein